MFVRFVINRLDPDSGRRQGILQALRELRDDDLLLPEEQEVCDEVFAWLFDNLDRPDTFSRSRKRHAAKVALSWFKPTAREHIARMHVLARVLEAHGLQVDIIEERRPGYIVHEDEYQVVAEPFQETRT
ncbi:hypothetical protein [Cystobacter ferrugineus]|uniref:Uncharacterized protein n=1 Tax=Cystobacter ferrugineus TaxID=83449 RepID=A0A1L9BJM6_9BACT|nr:hypothetical protein [Cystobacter ferrugineus]OJH42502.1 hypothetical protein BON30_04730 [Cystobacter ferrugineus]